MPPLDAGGALAEYPVMSLRLCILASGSSGNCTFVASDETAILIDAGLSARETAKRLEKAGSSLDRIRGVCISHEHGDHIAGLKTLNGRHDIPLFANDGTIQFLQRDEALAGIAWRKFHTGSAFAIGDLTVEPFSVPHDAMEPVGFIVSHGAESVGIVTDIGMPTALVRERLGRCRAVVIESNHDEEMLMNSQRPWSLKQRIMGRQGHLSNTRAAQMLAEIAGPQLQRVFLAHLSQDCNRQDIAWRATRDALQRAGHTHVTISLTFPDNISEIWPAA